MFTGIVKLAQIDDYISPSQNCIQPKILKKSQQQPKATVTLNDCLACSGCITSAQSVLIQQMSLQKFKSILMQQQKVFIIISPQSLISLSLYYSIQPFVLFQKLSQFFMNNFNKSIQKIYHLYEGIKISHQLIFNQFINKYNENNQNNQNQPILCSQCPGWVCYAQKTLNHQVTQYMSQIKSPQQIMGRLIKQKYGNQCKVITIMPCFDKKLQAIRFNIDQKYKQVDITLATNQVQNLIKQFGQNYLHNIIIEQSYNNKLYNQNLILTQSFPLNPFSFLHDQTSNSYISTILTRLFAINISQKPIKNNDFIQITAQLNNGQIIKMAKCYGFRNIQKIVSLIKRKKCQYSYVEIMACPGGCYSGGGQIRYEDKKQKDIHSQFKELQKKYIENQLLTIQKYNQKQIQKINNIDCKVEYKPIEKSFQASVMNW